MKTETKYLVGWLEFNVPFQHKYGYIRDETKCSLVIIFHHITRTLHNNNNNPICKVPDASVTQILRRY